MVQHEPKSCRFCGDTFTPHPKVGSRQISCSKPICKMERVRLTRRQWYRNNPGYNYENVKEYRQAHPDYQKQWRRRKKHQSHKKSRLPSREIQNQLSHTKTIADVGITQPSHEIQTELTLYFSVPLSGFLQVLPAARRSEIQNQLAS